MKSTPSRGVKEILKPYAYKESELRFTGVTVCLLKNEPTSVWQEQVKLPKATEPERKRVLTGASSCYTTRNRVSHPWAG